CMPLLVIHTIAVSLTTYRLVRKVQRQNRQLDALNRRDPLTGLASRDHWLAHARRLLTAHHAEGRPASLLLVDIDHFKAVNDRHGHAAGDEALRRVGRVLSAHAGADDLAGRISGDELGLLLAAGRQHAAVVADGIRHQLAAADPVTADSDRVTVSIGLAEADPGDHDLHTWMDAADRALYRAKRRGRNRVETRDRASAPALSDKHRAA